LNLKVFWIRLLNKLGILDLFRLRFRLKILDTLFWIPVNAKAGINNLRMDEHWMTELFLFFKLKDNALLVDVGANVGQSMLKWKAVYPESRYIGIEPNPEAFDYLNNLIGLNGLSNCQLHRIALYDSKGVKKLRLHFNDPVDRTASLVEMPFESTGHSMTVHTDTLANVILNQQSHTDGQLVLKIDAEGSEAAIVLSSLEKIKSSNALIIVEIIPEIYTPSSWSLLYERIVSISYNWYLIEKQNNRLSGLKHYNANALPRIPQLDFLLIPKHLKVSEKLTSIIH